MMTAEEIKELKKGIAITASYYGRDLLSEAIQFMAEDLSDLPFAKVSEAYLRYRRDPKNRTMPLPAQIRAIVQPTPDPEAEARAILDRIITAVNKFGWPQGEQARAFIGELGWRVVQFNGGWTELCQSNFIHNPGLLAQARNRAEDLIKYGDNFKTEAPVRIEHTETPALESKKFEALKAFEKYQAEKPMEIEIPSDEERKKMIQALIEKHTPKIETGT